MIAISGVGIICSMGLNSSEFYNSLIESEKNNFLKQPKNISTDFISKGVPLVAQVDLSDEELFDRLKLSHLSLKKIPRATLLALNAIKEAINDAKINESHFSSKRVGIFGGTSLAGTDRLEKIVRLYDKKKKINKLNILSHNSHSCVLKHIAEAFGWQGCRVMISTACSSSTVVMKFAQEYLLNDEIDIAVVFGTDPITETSISGFSVLGALKDGISSPFSQENIGISLGEGAAALILEKSHENTKDYYCLLGGVGVSSEAYHMTAPNSNGSGAREAMKIALSDTIEHGNSIDVIIAHGTGTELNDVSEANAINQLFKNSPLIISTKASTGHTLGAAGAINAVLACLCIKHKYIPKSPKFNKIREGINLNISSGINSSVASVLANSFGFGGSVASALFLSKNNNSTDTNKYSEKKEKIFISGIGIYSTFGCSYDILEKMLINGVCNFEKQAEIFSFSGRKKTQFYKKINLEDEKLAKNILKKAKNYRKMDKVSQISYVSVQLALSDSSLKINNSINNKIGLLMASESGSMQVLKDFFDPLLEGNKNSTNPSLFPNTVLNACIGYITIEMGLKGISALVSQGEVSAGVAFSLSKLVLSNNKNSIDAVIVGGVDEISEYQIKGFLDLNIIPDQNKILENDCIDLKINKYYLSEISISFVLEKEQSIISRGANKIVEFENSFSFGKNYKENLKPELFITEAINLLIIKTGVPDLIILNTGIIHAYDKLIERGISLSNAIGVKTYNPAVILGSYRSSCNAIGIFTAITAIKFQLLPSNVSNTLSVKASVKRVFVITMDADDYIVINVIKKND